MISCDAFRARFSAHTDEPELLEHVRRCEACLAEAAHVDPDVLFRALGGEELIPPGGTEAFVSDVMREVRLRSTENVVARRQPASLIQRLAVAATLIVGISAATLYYQVHSSTPLTDPAVAPRSAMAARAYNPTATKPVVEQYESENATIVEMPAEAGESVQVVMIFDENLPADL